MWLQESGNGDAVLASSPTLPLRLRWVHKEIKSYNRDAVASVPNVTFIPFDPMPPQQFTQFILEVHLVMVFVLIGNIALDVLKIRFTHREICITTLPLKIRKPELGFQPEVRHAFQFFNPFCLSNRAGKTREHVNMIFDPSG